MTPPHIRIVYIWLGVVNLFWRVVSSQVRSQNLNSNSIHKVKGERLLLSVGFWAFLYCGHFSAAITVFYNGVVEWVGDFDHGYTHWWRDPGFVGGIWNPRRRSVSGFLMLSLIGPISLLNRWCIVKWQPAGTVRHQIKRSSECTSKVSLKPNMMCLAPQGQYFVICANPLVVGLSLVAFRNKAVARHCLSCWWIALTSVAHRWVRPKWMSRRKSQLFYMVIYLSVGGRWSWLVKPPKALNMWGNGYYLLKRFNTAKNSQMDAVLTFHLFTSLVFYPLQTFPDLFHTCCECKLFRSNPECLN